MVKQQHCVYHTLLCRYVVVVVIVVLIESNFLENDGAHAASSNKSYWLGHCKDGIDGGVMLMDIRDVMVAAAHGVSKKSKNCL